ncbi:MAG TPA: thiamine diphosphokinase [Clostridiales bacterium]|mgnify:CR=1 FL=1|nr:thiamine diphosphokinase [Clostridiales bacterium]HQP70303.1 thiamine diphosphokinase [Clostridiales bacterium]
MITKTAIIVLNGKNFYSKGFLSALEKKPVFIIAADGGLKYLEELAVPPVIHIGDMDSSAPEVNVPVMDTLIYPVDKDRSDFFLALEFAYKKKVREVFVFAACGGRTDHFISNYDTAVDFASKGMKIIFSGSKEDIFFLPCIAPKNYEFNFRKSSTVSLFSGSDNLDGLTILGFKYPAVNLNLKRSDPVGLSNVCSDSTQKISFENGVLVLIYNKLKV